jgi:hypothetical protein
MINEQKEILVSMIKIAYILYPIWVIWSFPLFQIAREAKKCPVQPNGFHTVPSLSWKNKIKAFLIWIYKCLSESIGLISLSLFMLFPSSIFHSSIDKFLSYIGMDNVHLALMILFALMFFFFIIALPSFLMIWIGNKWLKNELDSIKVAEEIIQEYRDFRREMTGH